MKLTTDAGQGQRQGRPARQPVSRQPEPHAQMQPQQGPDHLPEPGNVPLVFDKPRRHLGCGLWLLILVLIIGIGGVVSWQLMSVPEREKITAQVTELVRETPLDFLRNWLMPRLDVHPPIPPINESGDGGVLPERRRPAPAAGTQAPGAIAPESAELVLPVQPAPEQETDAKAGEGSGDDEDGEHSEAKPAPYREDERVRPAFVDDLAGWLVDQYRPGRQGGSVSVSVQGLNQRYGRSMTGLTAPQGGAGGRASILRYAFTPSMVHAIYEIYADSLLESIARQAAQKSLTPAQVKGLYQSLGSRCILLAGGLESVAALPDLSGRVRALNAHEDAIAEANRAHLDARFDLERARDQGASTSAAQAAVDAAARNLQRAMAASSAEKNRLAEDIRRGGAGALSQDSIVYLARWVNRRLEENPSSLESVQASASVLRDLALRCTKAASDVGQDAAAPAGR